MAQGKRFRKASEGIDADKTYAVNDAVKMVKSNAKAKFDETIDICMNLGVDPRHADQMVRGMISLPSGTGKTLRVAVFAKGAKAEEAKAAGADLVGADDLAAQVQAGKIEFDRCIATPDMMAVVGRLGARDHAEDGGFAGAIGADEAHLLALLQGHRGVDEQDLVAVLLGDGIETDHGYGLKSGVMQVKRRGAIPTRLFAAHQNK